MCRDDHGSERLAQTEFRDDPQTGSIKVLVIDDSNTIRRSAGCFSARPAEVILAEDGFDASQISDHQPRVKCDIMMPRLDGYQPAR
jgi:CheY-like chemotaxis protein